LSHPAVSRMAAMEKTAAPMNRRARSRAEETMGGVRFVTTESSP
jgi:hypothetical protein